MENVDKTLKTKKQIKMRKKIEKIINNKEKKGADKLIDYLLVTFGAIIMAMGISLFLLPNELSTGGFSGIATILYYLIHFPLGTTTLILNIPLLLIAYFKVGKKLFVRSIYGTIMLSIFIDIFDKITPLTNDRFLGCIYGGVMMGIGTAVVLKNQASTRWI